MAAASTGEVGGRTAEREGPLHILTVNVNGLKEKNGKPRKNGKKLLNESEKSEVDVIFLGETHIGENDTVNVYEKDWTIFFTRYHFKSKGAAILVNKKRDFKLLEKEVDDNGRYVIVSCYISGTFCTFVSVYHRSDERRLLRELSEKIKPLYSDILVVGGDFNTALDEKKDTTSTSDNCNHKDIRMELQPFLKKHDLIDAWRMKHPEDRKYTLFRKRSKFRLDYVFINSDVCDLVQDCKINKDNISDHRSVSLFLDLKDLQIFSCTVHDLPRDEVLTELCPDVILLTKGEAEHEDYINKIKEEEGKTNWIVLWSDHSNAAILVTKRRRGINILFTAYHKNYVILHCKVLGMLHTFVSACHPTEKIFQIMLKEIMHSYSGRIVIGGDFKTSGQKIKELMNANKFNILEQGSMQLSYFIHAQLGNSDCKFKEQKILGQSYFLLILHLPKMKPENFHNITELLGKLKIHNCFSVATNNSK